MHQVRAHNEQWERETQSERDRERERGRERTVLNTICKWSRNWRFILLAQQWKVHWQTARIRYRKHDDSDIEYHYYQANVNLWLTESKSIWLQLSNSACLFHICKWLSIGRLRLHHKDTYCPPNANEPLVLTKLNSKLAALTGPESFNYGFTSARCLPNELMDTLTVQDYR